MENKQDRVLKAIRLSIASPEQIMEWSRGEVLKPETINYRTQKPEKDGLFCEKIFGPSKDWECYCGKYKRIRYKGVVCDKCGVEVTRSLVRRERMGHIELAIPAAHIWFLRGAPSTMGLVLGKSVKELEKVVYFAAYMVTEVNEELKKQALKSVDSEFKTRKQKLTKEKSNTKEIEKELASLEDIKANAKEEIKMLEKFSIISEIRYRELSMKFGEVFKAGIGAEVLQEILSKINLGELVKTLKNDVDNSLGQKRKKSLKRLKTVEGFLNAEIRPEWMIISKLPVIPPDLRPMVQLDGGRFAASDLNDLYRRVINRNNRLKKLVNLGAPEIICRNEKRMLQEAVDALIDNSARREKASQSVGTKRKLKSLADMLKGKQGRFRQNLLGKRVDYSGRSVIVVGPELRLHQCGLPKKMALELFKPFVISKLIKDGQAHNVKSASRSIERGRSEVWDALDEVIKDKLVLLNRAPTLHRLGIQAFQPVLVEGKAIKIHPLVCTAFNADFDGDMMAVHVPLSKQAQKEAREIMLSKENLLKPTSSEPIVNPSQDMVIGCFWMSKEKDGVKGEGKIFSDSKEAIYAYQIREINLQAKIKVRIDKKIMDTTVGRIIFNEIVPNEIGFINETLTKKSLENLVKEVFDKIGKEVTAEFVDSIKSLGFKYSTRSGLSIAADDIEIPEEKEEILKKAEVRSDHVLDQYNQGLITEQEKYRKMLNVWAETKEEIMEAMKANMDPWKSMALLLESGARGNIVQFAQLAGMKGNVVNAKGMTIELPIRANYKEGFSALEYFISTHGSRKTLSDTAIKTSDSGYLTRRLVDVAQDVIISEEDCKDKEGFVVSKKESELIGEEFGDRILGRILASNVVDEKTGEVIVAKKVLIGDEELEKILKAEISEVSVRSALSCDAVWGVCRSCYGNDLARGGLVKEGEAVGIIAAQSIGEPGTQLTMRTMHHGGVAGIDITQGLPRVEELVEARTPKWQAILSEMSGTVDVVEVDNMKVIKVIPETLEKDEYDMGEHQAEVKNNATVEEGEVIASINGKKKIKAKAAGIAKVSKDGNKIIITKEAEIKEYKVSKLIGLRVSKGDKVFKGQQLSDGSWNLQEALELLGESVVQRYIISEIQKIYSSQGVSINDKHLEIIVKQMFSRVRIEEPHDTPFVTGEVISRAKLRTENDKAKKEKKKGAEVESLLLSITKVSLSTDSFLSAASFQETSRTLIAAASSGKVDNLRGLKENVIIGKLIPVGTGYKKGAKR